MKEPTNLREPLAVVGLSCLFPDAESIGEYWNNIKQGRDSIQDIPATHWRPEDYFHSDPKHPDHTYANRGGFLRPYRFDPLRYGITPQSLEATDSTQLLGMVVAEEALRHAGYGPEQDFNRDRVSCILGVTGTLELVIPLGARLGHPHWRRALQRAGLPADEVEKIVADIADSFVGWQEASFPGLLGNVVAGRIANRLDLGGTNAVVDAACASSLGALQTAMMELETGRADMVITGGMDTFNDIFMYMCFSKTPALSPSGDAKPFDGEGDGTILGEGLGAIVLKRLSDAERDGDRIFALIKGIGSSSDGRGKAIYAPTSKGQVKALRRAYQAAACEPWTIELVECHGTGTKVGDGVEIESLTEVYTSKDHADLPTTRVQTAIGSVKSQIGHTKAAAGVAGLIKAIMALHSKVLPPTIKLKKPHPRLVDSPFVTYDKARPWVGLGQHPRRAAVSAFGFGGSNFHCVLEEYQAQKTAIDWQDDYLALPFAETSHQELQAKLGKTIKTAENWPIAQVWEQIKKLANEQLSTVEAEATFRLVMLLSPKDHVVSKLQEASALLQRHKPDQAWSHPSGIYYGSGPQQGSLAFIFSGQGSQYVDMLRRLAIQFPEMLDYLQLADRIWAEQNPDEPRRLSDFIYPPAVYADDMQQQRLEEELKNTAIAQPAIGAVSAGLLKMMERFGILPDLVAGHSFGELTALHAAGVLNAEEFLRVACLRGQVMHNLDPNLGSMLAIRATIEEVEEYLQRFQLDAVIANHNAPKQVVIAGPAAEIDRAWQCLQGIQVHTTRLNVAAAFHSPIVAPAVEPFHQALQQIPVQVGRLPIHSNVGPGLYPETAEDIRQQLSSQIAEPVRFVGMVRSMYQQGARIFIEIGPQKALTGLVRSILAQDQHADQGMANVNVMAIDDASSDQVWQGVLKVLAQVFVAGVPVKWSAIQVPEFSQDQSQTDRFHVEISGANYRSKQVSTGPSGQVSNKSLDRRPQKSMPQTNQARSQLEGKDMNDSHDQFSSTPPEARTHLTAKDTAVQPESLRLLEKHLLAMQEMQARNADLHHKYLEGQAASQKVIGDLLQDYRQLVGLGPSPQAAPSPLQASSIPLAKSQQVSASKLTGASQHQGTPGSLSAAPVAVPRQQEQDQKPPLAMRSAAEKPAPANQNRAIEAQPNKGAQESDVSVIHSDEAKDVVAILAMIADKTGYPTDMLALDMHLESDLGIDSIKRVEIFAALQELFPQLAGLPADQLAQMERIADIVELIAGDKQQEDDLLPSRAALEAADSALTEPSGSLQIQVSGKRWNEAEILAVISEKTGYPVDMLTSAMDLESDLGIDSIKRVEIFSELQTQSGDGQGFDAETLNQVHTIADIVALIVATSSDVPAAEADRQDSAEYIPEKGQSYEHPAAPESLVMMVISEKTGYPIDMLQVDLDLESDLGIDSIKLVEILSALGEIYPQIVQADQQQISEAHTIADLLKILGSDGDGTAHYSDPFDELGELLPQDEIQIEGLTIHPEMALLQEPIILQRSILEFEEFTELEIDLLQLPKEAKVWVTDDGSNLARNIVLKLREKGCKPRLVSISFVDRMKAPEQLDGLVLLAPQKIEGSVPRFLTNAFKLIKLVGPALQSERTDSTEQRLLTVVTRNGGYFGLQGLEHGYLAYSAALAGLAKSLRHEWPDVLVTVLDLGKNFADGFEAANRLLDACRQSQEVELGVFSRNYVRPILVDHPLGEENPMQFGVEDSVLLTGGARGVTFAVAHRLAHDFQSRLIIWGRTQLTDEPEWLRGVNDEPAIIQTLREHSSGVQRSPKDWLQECRRILAQREVKENIQKLRDLGSEVLYQSVDVRSDQQITTAIDELVQDGIIPTGLIHGAGVLADRKALDLDENDFLTVVDTKIRLLAHLERDIWQSLRFCVFFSSSTGRFGRQGQSAYAVANEALNKFAHYFQGKLPHCRTVAINWGPWDGGMVDKQLKNIFKQEGLATIPLPMGADYLLHELAQKQHQGIEVVCLAKEGAELSTHQAIHQTILLNVENFPVLRSHVMKGLMVLPVVLHLELMIEKVKQSIPGLKFQGFGNFRVLRGLKLTADDTLEMRLVLGEQSSVNGGLKVAVSLEALDPMRQEWFVSSSAEIWLVEEKIVVSSPVLEVASELDLLDSQELYAQYLFHGPHFQGIEDLQALSEQGADAWVKTAVAPRFWLNDDLLDEWNLDPLAIDCSFQLGVIWTSMTKSLRSLPISIHSYLQYQDHFPADGCRVCLVAHEVNDREFEASIEYIDRDGHLIASMKAYRGIMDESLLSAFHDRHLSDASPEIF